METYILPVLEKQEIRVFVDSKFPFLPADERELMAEWVFLFSNLPVPHTREHSRPEEQKYFSFFDANKETIDSWDSISDVLFDFVNVRLLVGDEWHSNFFYNRQKQGTQGYLIMTKITNKYQSKHMQWRRKMGLCNY